MFRRIVFALAVAGSVSSATAFEPQWGAVSITQDLGFGRDGAVTHIADFLQFANMACEAKLATPHPVTVHWSGACNGRWLEGEGMLTISLPNRGFNQAASVSIAARFVSGHLEGRAVISFTDSPLATFEGEFHDGLPNGHGVAVDTSGMRIEGDYFYDRLTGKATVTFPDKSRIALAAEGTPVRSGQLHFDDGTVFEVAPPGEPYHTLTTFPDGSRLEVTNSWEWQRPGLGVFCTANGRRIAGKFVPPRFIEPPTAPYPSLSLRLREQGTAAISLLVGADGEVSDVALHVTSGFKRLDNAATMTAASRWRFAPASIAGRPLAVRLVVNVAYYTRVFPPEDVSDVPVTVLDGPMLPETWLLKSCRRH